MNQTNVKPQAVIVHFFTFRNGTTNGWLRSPEYSTVEQMLQNVPNYLKKYPNTTFQFQTRVVYK